MKNIILLLMNTIILICKDLRDIPSILNSKVWNITVGREEKGYLE